MFTDSRFIGGYLYFYSSIRAMHSCRRLPVSTPTSSATAKSLMMPANFSATVMAVIALGGFFTFIRASRVL